MFHYIPKVLYLQYHIKHKVKLEKKKHKKMKGQSSVTVFLVSVLVTSVSPPCCSKHGGEAMMLMLMMETMMIFSLPSAISVPQNVQIKVYTIM